MEISNKVYEKHKGHGSSIFKLRGKKKVCTQHVGELF